MDYCLLIPSQSRVLCRGEQLLLTFSDEGSSQLKLFSASLTLQSPECIDPTFSRSRIKRRGQREKVASSNRLPRFLIGVCSTLVGFETEQSAGFFLEDRDGEGSYVLSIPFLDSPFVSREPSGMDISRLVTALVTVNSNNKEE